MLYLITIGLGLLTVLLIERGERGVLFMDCVVCLIYVVLVVYG